MPFFGSLRTRLKKRVAISLAGDPSWGLLVNGKSWLCPFCAQVGVEEVPEAEDARAERVLDHLVDAPCADFREGEGAPRPIQELKKEVASRELRRRVKKDLARNGAWQLMDLSRRWFCPFCAEATEIAIPAERVMPEDTVRAIVGHVEACAGFAKGRGETKPLESLKATVKNANRARKLAEDVRRKVEQDPVWRQKDARARWICPFCLAAQSDVDLSTSEAMFEKAPELMARHLGTCERWREGATPRLAQNRAPSGSMLTPLGSSGFPEKPDRAPDAGPKDERSSSRLLPVPPGITQRTGPRKQKAATDVWGRDALNAPTEAPPTPPPGPPPGAAAPPRRGTTLRSLESSSEHNLIDDPEVRKVTSSNRPKRSSRNPAASGSASGTAGSASSGGGVTSSSVSGSASGAASSAMTPIPGGPSIEDSSHARSRSVDWRKEIERELAAVRSQVPSWNDGSSHGLEDTAQAEVRDAAQAAASIPGVEVRVLIRPGSPPRGDFVEVIAVGEGRLAVLLGGVASEESEGALVAAMARNLVRMNVRRESDPAAVLRRVNQEIFQDLDARTFVSALVAIFDARTRRLAVARAGLPAPYLVNKARSTPFGAIECDGMVMGIDRGPIFDTTVQTRVVDLAPGDLVAFVSSGLLEVRNASREELGLERAQNAIRKYGFHEAEYLVHKMGQVLDEWTRGSDPAADACLAGLKIAPQPGKS